MEDEYECFNGYEPKSPNAIDFYDISDVASDEDGPEGVDSPITPVEKKNILFNGSDSYPSLIPKAENVIFGKGDKPLAGVLPAKYQEADVKNLFPNYHHDKSLRHFKLFDIAKKNLPNLWRGVKNRKDQKLKSSVKFIPKELEIESDEEIKFMHDKPCIQPESSLESVVRSKPVNNAWRFGAAKLWYDMVEVPENTETYDYGFKLKEPNDDSDSSVQENTSDNAYLLVEQSHWEDDVIWDGEDVREEVMEKALSSKSAAGWLPFLSDRTAYGYNEYLNNVLKQNEDSMSNYGKFTPVSYQKKVNSESMFPEENIKLIYDRWEDDVIWDCDKMTRITGPKSLEILDPDILLEIPEDKPPIIESPGIKDPKSKKQRPSIKKVNEDEEETTSAINKPDMFNISNDEYYNPKMTKETALKLNYSGSLLQHSIPAVELRPPYFPTNFGFNSLQRFHRPTLKKYSHGPLAYFGEFHGVKSLYKNIKHKAKERLRELEESGGGEMFFMRTPADLSGQDGDLVLFEFSEEFPPLMSQVGMASKIRNYYRRRPGKETSLIDYKYGEVAYAHTSPFLGALQPGQSLQAYENHLFRAPIYQHQMPSTDFLIIRTRYKYFIREIETIFTVGQQLPLLEVPAPKSEKTKNFTRDFLTVFIYRLFWQSKENPRRITIETIKKAFPSMPEFKLRKRLNQCASFQRTGTCSKFWILNEGFRLPSEEEIRQLISPEQCCAYYSMISAEQRLKDSGYENKFFMTADDENEDFQHKIEDEVKAAPWNTTQAFISAVEGKCMLELNGSADPTGCGEGFSYVKIPNKPHVNKDDTFNPTKRLVRGTDADLRKLSINKAKKILKELNISDKEIKGMTRWQIIDVVRTVSTEQAKLCEDGVMPKFARGNFHSQAEHAKRYKEECQRLFDLQNNVLSSTEILSTDEDSSSEEDSDIEEMGKHIESIISNKKTAKELSHENEEAERKELQKLIASEQPIKDVPKNNEEKAPSSENKILKIYRTYKNSNGKIYERVETVRKSAVIERYLKLREMNPQDIDEYSTNPEEKEAKRKERRRIQDQLRRIKKYEMKVGMTPTEPPKKKIKVETPSLKVKCGACGASGHMRTNRACPLYQNTPSLPPVQVAMTEEQEENIEQANLNDQNLVKVDETKIILSKQLFNHVDEIRRKSLLLKIPKSVLKDAKKKRSYELANSDYLSTPKGINRKRIDPMVSISILFENLINDLKALSDTQPFWHPVSVKIAPNYFEKIEKPMDLHTMKENIRQHKYKCREDFIKDLQQIIDNSSVYNGPHSFLTLTAHSMLEYCVKVFSEKEERLMELEKAINPLLDNDQVAFSFILETIVSEQLKTVPESWPFHKPVEKRLAKGYYDIIKNPMDLNTIISHCKAHKYNSRQAFLNDVELIFSNSELFNGVDSNYTRKAQEIVQACHVSLDIYKEQLERLEAGLKNASASCSFVSNTVVPKKAKRTNKTKTKIDYTAHSSKHNGSAESDSFVDIESLDSIPDNNEETIFSHLHSDKSDPADLNSQQTYGEELNLSENSDIEENEVQKSDSFLDDLKLTDSESDEDKIVDMEVSEVIQDQNVVLPCDSSYSELCPQINYDLTSPNASCETSLQHINGFLEESYGENSNINSEPINLQNTCDNICDDLRLSESDSDDNMPIEHALQF